MSHCMIEFCADYVYTLIPRPLYKQPWYEFEARLYESCMEVACDLVVALDCILKGPKLQSHLQLTFSSGGS